MPTQIHIESYIDREIGHIDTLRIDGEFKVYRAHKAAYLIHAADRFFIVTVKDGAKTSVIAFQGDKSDEDKDLTLSYVTDQWPVMIQKMEANYNGYFHLERNNPDEYFFGTPWDAFHFRTISGPAKQQLIVQEYTEEINAA